MVLARLGNRNKERESTPPGMSGGSSGAVSKPGDGVGLCSESSTGFLKKLGALPLSIHPMAVRLEAIPTIVAKKLLVHVSARRKNTHVFFEAAAPPSPARLRSV